MSEYLSACLVYLAATLVILVTHSLVQKHSPSGIIELKEVRQVTELQSNNTFMVSAGVGSVRDAAGWLALLML